MPAAGAVQVTSVALVCLQVEGGSLPVASPLLLARTSAAISGLGVGLDFGVGDIFIAALACEPEPLRPTQVPTPTRTRTAAASAAIQRGRRYHCGSRGPPGGGRTGLPRIRDAVLTAVRGDGPTGITLSGRRLARAGRRPVIGLAVRGGGAGRDGIHDGATRVHPAGHGAPGELVRRWRLGPAAGRGTGLRPGDRRSVG